MAKNKEKTLLKDRKRAAILVAAVDEFQENGFDGTSMDRIAATADVSKRTVYNHFPSKEHLFEAIITELLARCQDFDFRYSPERPLKQQLLENGKHYIEIMTSDDFMKLSRVVLSRFIQSPELAGSMVRGKDETHQAIVNWIQAASNDGRLSIKNASQAATQFTSLIKSFAFWPQLISNQKPLTSRELKQITESAVAIFLDHYEK